MSGVQFSLRFEPPPRHDLFYFALRPDGFAATAAIELARACCRRHGLRGNPVSVDRLHVSLCPAMSRRGPRKGDIAAAMHAAAQVQAEAFDIGFDRLCAFGRGERPAVVLRCAAGKEPIARLRESLSRELVKAGLRWAHSSFAPHLTVLWGREAVPETRLERPICWRAGEFVLVQSLVGCSRHIDLGKWPLARKLHEHS